MAKEQPIETIVHQGVESERRLLELDLTLDGVLVAIRQGEYARMEATTHDPINASGFDAYRYRVRGLRDKFCPGGMWRPEVVKGVETLLHKSNKRSVVTRAGDGGVGLVEGWPQPKQEVGDVVASAVGDNTALLFDPNFLNRGPIDHPIYETWMLLVYRRKDTVRAELSLPTAFDGDDRVMAWFERILLPAEDFSDEHNSSDDSGDADDEDDVQISRRP